MTAKYQLIARRTLTGALLRVTGVGHSAGAAPGVGVGEPECLVVKQTDAFFPQFSGGLSKDLFSSPSKSSVFLEV